MSSLLSPSREHRDVAVVAVVRGVVYCSGVMPLSAGAFTLAQVSVSGNDFRLVIERRYQKLAARGDRGNMLHVLGARLRGNELRFTAFDRDGTSRHYSGRLQGGRLVGESDVGNGAQPLHWSATRRAD